MSGCVDAVLLHPLAASTETACAHHERRGATSHPDTAQGGRDMSKMAKAALTAVAVAVTASALPAIKRYIEIRAM